VKRTDRPLIGISVGDPGGIGPEVTVKALALPQTYRICRPLVVADAALMREAVRVAGAVVELRAVRSPAEGTYRPGVIDVLDLGNVDLGRLRYGMVSAEQGRASFEFVRRLIELALAGEIDATVTGPIHKEALNLAGFRYAGHTEIYADLTGTRDYAMMLLDGDFRVAHVSTHLSLRQAIERVRIDRVLTVIRLAADALERMGIPRPRIAVAGLNPHAGEGGLFGAEEVGQIAPAVQAAQAEGRRVEGPLPADTVFPKMRGGQYDLVVVMYHDQGHIPVKLLGFRYDKQRGEWRSVAGVNVTLGLPIIRTSVDHGVAFDRAGAGTANPRSMVEAIRTAADLRSGRRARRRPPVPPPPGLA
jgi:4-hydroxythreonine-4-phosphate dehydrogenase